MNDKFKINLRIADRLYPLYIRRDEEMMVRKAARLVDKKLATYMERFQGGELTTQNFLAMIAFQFSYDYLKLSETRDVDVVLENIQEIDRELDDYLNGL